MRHEGISSEIFGYCLLNEFKADNSVSFDKIRKTIGSYLMYFKRGARDFN